MAKSYTTKDVRELWDKVEPALWRDFHLVMTGDNECILYYNSEPIAMQRWDVCEKLLDLLDDLIDVDLDNPRDPFNSITFLPPRCIEGGTVDVMQDIKKNKKVIRWRTSKVKQKQ